MLYRIVRVIGVILIVLTISACSTNYDMSIEGEAFLNDRISMNTEDLEAKYEGKLIEYTGIIEEFANNLIVNGISLYGGVNCEISLDDVADDVKPHTKITIVGTGEFSETRLLLTDCKITELFDDIELTIEAEDYDQETMSIDAYSIVEITGSIDNIVSDIGYNHVLLLIEENDTMNEVLGVSFSDTFDVSPYQAGDQITLYAVWDGEFFYGYEIISD